MSVLLQNCPVHLPSLNPLSWLISLSLSAKSSESSGERFIKIDTRTQLQSCMNIILSSFHAKGKNFILTLFPILQSLPDTLAKAERLHIFLQLKTTHFYQVKDFV